MMTCEEAFLHMRADPQYAGIVRDAYVGADLFDAAARFAASAEFAEVVAVLGERGRGKVVDLGAGNGIASAALADAGAQMVYALEPDPSCEIGSGAIEK